MDVLYRRFLELYDPIKNIRDKAKKSAKIKTAANELAELADAIPVSCTTNATERLENTVYKMKECSLDFAGKYMGLSYLTDAIAHLLLQLLYKYKKMMLDSWDTVFTFLFAIKEAPNTVEQFKMELCRHLVGIPNAILQKHDQKDIASTCVMSQIVIDAYLSKSQFFLTKQKFKEKRIKLTPQDKIDNYPDTFKEAQKSFRSILSRDDEIKYSNLVQDFINNNKD